MKRLRILNLYAGIGGNRKKWGSHHEITAVEINEEIAAVYKDHFPNDKLIVGDAHQYLLDHYKDFDFVWASPPCPTHSRMMISGTNRKVVSYPDMKLYQEIIFLNQFFKGKYVIENVIPYYTPLISAQKVGRHLFWANLRIGKHNPPEKRTNLNDMKKQDFLDWLGYENIPNIYIGDNHCNIQVLRNCVHPETGLYILNQALNILEKSNIKQLDAFSNLSHQAASSRIE